MRHWGTAQVVASSSPWTQAETEGIVMSSGLPELRDGIVGVVDRLAPLLAQDAHAHIRSLLSHPTIPPQAKPTTGVKYLMGSWSHKLQACKYESRNVVPTWVAGCPRLDHGDVVRAIADAEHAPRLLAHLPLVPAQQPLAAALRLPAGRDALFACSLHSIQTHACC